MLPERLALPGAGGGEEEEEEEEGKTGEGREERRAFEVRTFET